MEYEYMEYDAEYAEDIEEDIELEVSELGGIGYDPTPQEIRKAVKKWLE